MNSVAAIWINSKYSHLFSKTLGLINQPNFHCHLKDLLPKSWCVLKHGDISLGSKPAFVCDLQTLPDPECFMINVNSMNEYNVIIVYHRVAVTFHWAERKTVTATQENNCTSPTGISCQPLLMHQHSLFHFVSLRLPLHSRLWVFVPRVNYRLPITPTLYAP